MHYTKIECIILSSFVCCRLSVASHCKRMISKLGWNRKILFNCYIFLVIIRCLQILNIISSLLNLPKMYLLLRMAYSKYTIYGHLTREPLNSNSKQRQQNKITINSNINRVASSRVYVYIYNSLLKLQP
mgnify:CR=1 FL=1